MLGGHGQRVLDFSESGRTSGEIGARQGLQSRQQGMSVAKLAQLCGRLAGEIVERAELVRVRDAHQASESPGFLAPLTDRVHGRFEVDELVGLDQPGQACDCVVEPFVDDPDDLTTRSGLRVQREAHFISFRFPHSNVAWACRVPTAARAAELIDWTFTDPEVGAVGLTEAEAPDCGLHIIVDVDRDILVGATSVGPVGGEVLRLILLAVHATIPVRTVRSMIFAYPTFHKGIEDALDELS